MSASPSSPSAGALGALVSAVQANCHVADARHATELPLCIYLLQMRELYRWERGLAFGTMLDRDDVGCWLAAREDLWTRVEASSLQPLPWQGRLFDPQDADALNAVLVPHGLLYGVGHAGSERLCFFVARLHHAEQRGDDLSVQIAGAELARSLFAPPAALAGGSTIVLRRESLARWLWERFEAFSLRPSAGPFQSLADAYRLTGPGDFVAALPRLVDDQSETLLLHELGEHRAARELEPRWSAMRLALRQRRTEALVAAVRDHLADLLLTLPTLLERGDVPAMHFWFAGYEGQRQRLFPSLLLAYEAWRAGDAGRQLTLATQRGSAHFRRLADEVLVLHDRLGAHAGPAIDSLLMAPAAVCPAAAH